MTSTIGVEPVVIELEDWTSTGSIADLPARAGNPPDILLWWSAAGTNVWNSRALGVARLFADDASTGAGHAAADPVPNFQQSVTEIRRRSSLTWDQLARVFGVGRRSVHFWARGARPSGENAERIGAVLRIVREIDTGDADRTRAVLLDPSTHGRSIFELLCEGHDTEAALLSRGVRFADETEDPGRRVPRRRRPPALTVEERRRRQAFELDDLLGGFESPSVGRLAVGGSLGGGLVTGLRI